MTIPTEHQEQTGAVHWDLPWPPTVNHYWKRGRGTHVYVSKAGKQYRKDVADAIGSALRGVFEKTDRLWLIVDAFPPDRRRRDLDNILKALLDSVAAALDFDDAQIDRIAVERCAAFPGGAVRVSMGIVPTP